MMRGERARLAPIIDDELRASMTRMIRNSSNRDATAVLKRVGFERLAEILQSDPHRLYDPEHGGGLWVGRDYGGGEAWKRDPLNNVSHAASTMQVARFYYLLATDRLSTREYCAEMLAMLSDPAIEHKFVKGLMVASPDATIARKSGTWRSFHADSGIIESRRHRCILVIIDEHPDGGGDLVRAVKVVERVFAGAAPSGGQRRCEGGRRPLVRTTEPLAGVVFRTLARAMSTGESAGAAPGNVGVPRRVISPALAARLARRLPPGAAMRVSLWRPATVRSRTTPGNDIQTRCPDPRDC